MNTYNSFFIILVGRLLQSIAGLASVKLMTTLLSKQEVGTVYLANAILTYFCLIFLNPIGMYFNRNFLKWKDQQIARKSLFALSLYYSFISFLAIPFILFFSEFSINQVVFFFPFFILTSAWYQGTPYFLNLLGHKLLFVLANILFSVSSLFLSLGFIFWFEKTAIHWLIGVVGGQFLSFLFTQFFLNKILKEPISRIKNIPWEKIPYKKIIYFSFPIVIANGFIYLQNQSYRVVVEKFFNPQLLAILGVSFGIAGNFAGVVESLFHQYFYPAFYSTITFGDLETRKQAWQRLFRLSIYIYLPFCIFIFSTSQYLLKVFVGPNYHEFYGLTSIAILSEFFRMQTTVVSSISQSEMKTKNTIIPYAIGSFVVLAGVGIAVKLQFSHPLILISLSILLANFTNFIFMIYQMKKIFQFNLEFKVFAKSLILTFPLFIFSVYSFPFNVTTINSILILIFSGMILALIQVILIFRELKGLKKFLNLFKEKIIH